MLADIDRAGASPVTRLAARFLALKDQRPGMVQHREESEGAAGGGPPRRFCANRKLAAFSG
jgi:hypothetical protein